MSNCLACVSHRSSNCLSRPISFRNATKAAIAAGFSERSANNQGARLMANDAIRAEIDARLAATFDRYVVTSERIIRELALLAFGNIGDFITVEEGGSAIVNFGTATREQKVQHLRSGGQRRARPLLPQHLHLDPGGVGLGRQRRAAGLGSLQRGLLAKLGQLRRHLGQRPISLRPHPLAFGAPALLRGTIALCRDTLGLHVHGRGESDDHREGTDTRRDR